MASPEKRVTDQCHQPWVGPRCGSVLLITPLRGGGEDARTQEGGRGCGQGLRRASTGDPQTRKAQTSPEVPGQKNEHLHQVGGTDRGSRFREAGFAEKLGEDLNTAEARLPDPLHQKKD